LYYSCTSLVKLCNVLFDHLPKKVVLFNYSMPCMFLHFFYRPFLYLLLAQSPLIV
jgi:hypothetical protein